MQLEMRGVNYKLDGELKDHIEGRLRFALGRFAARIDRLMVRLTDVNGPRGGIDKCCRIAVALVPRGMVMAEGLGDDPFALVSDAARRARRVVRRALKRRRHDRAGAVCFEPRRTTKPSDRAGLQERQIAACSSPP